MRKTLFLALSSLFFLACVSKQSPLSDQSVQKATDAAVSWQVEAYPGMNDIRVHKSDGDLSWQNATFLFAMMEWAEYTGNTDLLSWGYMLADTNQYRLSKAQRIYHADGHVVSDAVCFRHIPE